MIIFAKKIVGRKETLEYANKKFNWKDDVIGVSCFFGFWAWLFARLTRRKCIYYCIDFYSPKIAKDFIDGVFIYLAMQMDKFLLNHVDEVWDISNRIKEGRLEYGHYFRTSTIVPLSYPKSYFRFETDVIPYKIAFVGLEPYGIELLDEYVWLGHEHLLELDDLLNKLSRLGIGVSLWKEKGNNYYGDPGKTKLYSACGLPVIMTDNTPYAEIIKSCEAGIIVPYDKKSVFEATKKILQNYWFYKYNVKKTWRYIDTDEVFSNTRLLE
jgi:glycosyltransferase involved in cell wall biosynthesis